MRESTDAALLRWQKLEALQLHYPHFVPFLEDMMTELGFNTSDIQRDIAEYLEHGPHYLMIQAQRGQLASIMLKQGNPKRAILTTH